MDNQVCNFYIVNIKDQYFIFSEGAFLDVPEPFHTSELAHLWLIEKAKELSTDTINVMCVEVEREYIFIKEKVENETDNMENIL